MRSVLREFGSRRRVPARRRAPGRGGPRRRAAVDTADVYGGVRRAVLGRFAADVPGRGGDGAGTSSGRPHPAVSAARGRYCVASRCRGAGRRVGDGLGGDYSNASRHGTCGGVEGLTPAEDDYIDRTRTACRGRPLTSTSSRIRGRWQLRVRHRASVAAATEWPCAGCPRRAGAVRV
jgi:hypothetical protein